MLVTCSYVAFFSLDLGMLLGNKPSEDSATTVTRQTEELAKQTANFMAQFTKQATETIKNAVGVSYSFVYIILYMLYV